jgi:hypothetical protein
MVGMRPLLHADVLASLIVAALAAGCSDDVATGGGGSGAGSSGGASAGGGNQGGASSQGGGFQSGGGGAGGEAACVQDSSDATLVNQPVDIVFVIDNSGSMTAEIEEVEEQINSNFAAIIDSAVPAIDYRVIMVSAFGDSADQRICVAAPLGGIPDDDADGHCDNIPGAPVNTANFFHHGAEISSHDALCELLDQLTTADPDGLQPTGYEAVLRPEAFKFFAVITDDNVSCDGFDDQDSAAGGQTVADAWDAAMQAAFPAQFGADAATRRYSFWSIVAMAPYMPSGADPYGSPHPPDAALAPIVTDECTPSAVNPGTGYQALSILSGGYRFPTCGLDYTDIFTLMAQGVIEGAAAACEFEIPDPPPGEMLDLETVQVRYTSGEGAITTFEQVPTLADCTPEAFYIDADMIELCPETCALVQGDEGAEIDVLYGCAIVVE